MMSRLLIGALWTLVILSGVAVSITVSAMVLAWLIGYHDPIVVGMIIGANTIRAHVQGIFALSLILAAIGIYLGILPSAAGKDRMSKTN